MNNQEFIRFLLSQGFVPSEYNDGCYERSTRTDDAGGTLFYGPFLGMKTKLWIYSGLGAPDDYGYVFDNPTPARVLALIELLDNE